MLYREIITVCSQIHTKYINTHCGHFIESFVGWRCLNLPLCFTGLSIIAEEELSVVGERYKKKDMMLV